MTSHAKKFSKLKRKSYGHAMLQYFCEQLDENDEFSLEDMHQMMDHALSYFLDLESLCIEAEIQRLEMMKQKVSEWVKKISKNHQYVSLRLPQHLMGLGELVPDTGTSMSEEDRSKILATLNLIENEYSAVGKDHQVL